ncbi:MAG: aminoglycoside phosphotransferase family protein, partial [Geodermatophilaceae bacterium]|nr:aminoglycoside phosphotransferase family protein [Geodermatophilaceae bacterium]
ERIGAEFGVSIRELGPVPGGYDVDAAVYRAMDGSGVEWAVKLSRTGRLGGLVLTQRLARDGVLGITGPLPARDGEPFAVFEDAWLSVTPWVRGRAATSAGMDKDRWRRLGALIADVHAMTPTEAEAARIPGEDYRTSALNTLADLDTRLGDADPEDRLLAKLCRTWWSARDSIDVICTGTRDLGDLLRAAPSPGVVGHGDPHLGNVQIDDDGGLWLLDWDEAALAPPERDLMFVLGGVLLAWPAPAQLRTWFAAGYGPVVVDPVRLAYFRCERAVEDVLGLAEMVLDAAPDPTAMAEVLGHFLGALSPSGIATAALASLREIGRD